jgi:cobalt transporter subunit CbtA
MLRHILASAVIAGLAAGAIAAAVQNAFVVPVLIEAELYETGERSHFGAAPLPAEATEHAHPPAAPPHDHAPAAAPHADEEGEDALASRMLMTALAQLVTYTGFAFLLIAGFALAARAGIAVDAGRGTVWGLAGFAAVQLLPAMGLPPELPGSGAADLGARQIWWVLAVAAGAAGLALLAFGRSPGLRAAGAVLVALPHVIGAPHPAAFSGVAPPELAGLFAARSLGTGAIAWAVLGLVAGHLWARGPAPRPAAA